MFWLIKGAFKTGKDDYAHVVNSILGKKAGIILHCTFIFLTFSVATLYFIVSSNFTPSILKGFGLDSTLADSNNTRIYIIIGILILMFPLGL